MGKQGSELVIMDERVMEMAARAQPDVATLNVTKSSKVHIGPKFISVTQNVDNTEVIKDLPFYRYLWNWVKSTSKAERMSCAAATLVLIVCIVLMVYFLCVAKRTTTEIDVAPHEWFITREMWLAPPFNTTDRTDYFDPLRLVIIAHTVSPECTRFANCAAELRNLQGYYTSEYKYDLPYNFVIGNDGRVYEVRGWNVVGAHTISYNNCSMGLAFIGDYREGLPSYSRVTALQLQRAQMLFAQGIELGYLHPDFRVLGAKDLSSTYSPGGNIYNIIRGWSNYDHNHIFKRQTCQQTYELLERNISTTERSLIL